MKKTVIYTFGFLLAISFLTACASKKGCGLTSDINKIEKTIPTENLQITAEV